MPIIPERGTLLKQAMNTNCIQSSGKKRKQPLTTRAQWWLNAQALYLFARLVGWCPDRLLPQLADGLGAVSYRLLSGRRKTGLRNVEMVWGATTTAAQRQTLIKGLFRNIARDMIEVVRLYDRPAQIGALNITITGQEHLDRALRKGNGVIAVSAHVGNFAVIGAQLASLGYPFWLIYKSPKNRPVAAAFREWMDRVGIRVISYKPRRLCARESLNVLKNNGIVFLLIDQNPRKRYGVYVDFFGYRVPTYAGPVILAQRSGAALVPMYICRSDDGSQHLTVLPELPVVRSADRNQTLANNLNSINRLYEQWISDHPSQWWWIHRRFRRAHPSSGNTQRRILSEADEP